MLPSRSRMQACTSRRVARRRARRSCSSSGASSRRPSSLDDILGRVVDSTAALIESPRTSIWLEDEEGWLIPRRLYGHTEEERKLTEARRVHVADARESLGDGPEPFVLHPDQLADAAPAEPLVYRSPPSASTGGSASSRPPFLQRDFGERELRLLGGLAHQAQLAIANASNYEGLEQTFVSTVEALANALEANDEYTSTHARWITDLRFASATSWSSTSAA